MELTSPEAGRRLEQYAAAAGRCTVGLDFDGVLSPIVDDPDEARIHPEAPEVLVDLAEVVRAIAVITGRPARQALALGDLDEVGARIGEHGKELFVFGQYGNERWSSTHRRIISRRSSASSRRCCAASTRPTPTSRRRASPSRSTPGGSPSPGRRATG